MEERMRQCRNCSLVKPLAAFAKACSRGGNTYHRHQCKRCDYLQKKEHRRINPDVDQSAKECARRAGRKARSTPEGWCARMVSHLRNKCRRTGIPFNLTKSALLEVMPTDGMCPALRVKLCFGSRSPNNPSVDRLHPKLGYVIGNVSIISRRANAIKQDATAEELYCVADWLLRAVRGNGRISGVEGPATTESFVATQQADPGKRLEHLAPRESSDSLPCRNEPFTQGQTSRP